MKIVTRGVVAVALGLVSLSMSEHPAAPEPETGEEDVPTMDGIGAWELADCLVTAA